MFVDGPDELSASKSRLEKSRMIVPLLHVRRLAEYDE